MTRQARPAAAAALAVLAMLALAQPALAGEPRREAGRHEHGLSELAVAQEGPELLIDLRGPAANFLGFEHAPRTGAERAALAAARALLEQGEKLFGLPAAARCRFVAARVTAPDLAAFDEEADEAEEDGHGIAEDEHDEDELAHGDENHSEMAVSYDVRCDAPQALSAIEVKVFVAFPGTGRIAASTVGPAGQTAVMLTPDNTVVRLRP